MFVQAYIHGKPAATATAKELAATQKAIEECETAFQAAVQPMEFHVEIKK